MYILSLKPNDNLSIFSDQTIYWYPLKLGNHRMLLSMNIATLQSKNQIEIFENTGRVILKKETNEWIYFIYFGTQGEASVFKVFEERPFIVKNGSLYYVFLEREIQRVFNLIMKKENAYKNATTAQIENYFSKAFERQFSSSWKTKFFRSDCTLSKYYAGDLFPNPILHLLDIIEPNVYDKIYYKDLLQFLIENDFLTSWVDPIDISENFRKEIILKCQEISKNEIIGIKNLTNVTERAVSNLFDKHDIFRISYLSAQCANQNSVFKILMQNLYSILPKKKKMYSNIVCPNFQPKFTVESIELHFIITISSTEKLKIVYNRLKEIADQVHFYDIIQHKILKDKVEIEDAINKHGSNQRHRFIIKVKMPTLLDYSELKEKISKIGNSVKGILIQEKISDTIREMWVKKINLNIFTPPQFEDDVLYSLAQSWIITLDTSIENIDEYGIKKIFVSLACDYQVFKGNYFVFPFDYASEIQYTYLVLNEKLELEHNFTHFNTNDMPKKP